MICFTRYACKTTRTISILHQGRCPDRKRKQLVLLYRIIIWLKICIVVIIFFYIFSFSGHQETFFRLCLNVFVLRPVSELPILLRRHFFYLRFNYIRMIAAKCFFQVHYNVTTMRFELQDHCPPQRCSDPLYHVADSLGRTNRVDGREHCFLLYCCTRLL